MATGKRGPASERDVPEVGTLRQKLDAILVQAKEDRELFRKLVDTPRATLESFGFDPWEIVAEQLGVGPSADCGHDTCRLTKECGWTVCGKTTNSCMELEDDLRVRMDGVLKRVMLDPDFRRMLIAQPLQTLERFDFDPGTARYVAEAWGVGPSADCGHDTCRLTKECGWTVCGKTTNSCAEFEDGLRVQMDKVLKQLREDASLREELVRTPEETLQQLGFEPAVSRYVAETWGIGPSGSCGMDTCRFTTGHQ